MALWEIWKLIQQVGVRTLHYPVGICPVPVRALHPPNASPITTFQCVSDLNLPMRLRSQPSNASPIASSGYICPFGDMLDSRLSLKDDGHSTISPHPRSSSAHRSGPRDPSNTLVDRRCHPRCDPRQNPLRRSGAVHPPQPLVDGSHVCPSRRGSTARRVVGARAARRGREGTLGSIHLVL